MAIDLLKLKVLGRRIAYRQGGSGRPILFLHGNPTSSYLWRKVMPHLTGLGRCIAPDLVGMGDSEPLPVDEPDRYRFVCHRRYLDATLEALQLDEPVILVVHDWGSALGFDWARRHPDRVAGIAYMEAIVRPMTWEEWPESIRSLFEGLRGDAGESMILDKNIFVEKILPGSIMRELDTEELNTYRRPYREAGDSRLPTLVWPREMPLAGEPADVVEIVAANAEWLAASPVPKLFINADPGAILVGAQRETCRSWPNQQEVTVPGIHFIQEDSPHEIGTAIADWMSSLEG